MRDNRDYDPGAIYGVLFKSRYKLIHAMLGYDYDPKAGVDVFLDLNSLIDSLSKNQKYMNSLPFSKNVEINLVSNMLTTVKHWKDFFRKWDGIRIFLIYNDFEMVMLHEQEKNKSYLYPYINKFSQERFEGFKYHFSEAMKQIDVILQHIPSIYVVKCNRLDSYVVPNLLDTYKERKRVIITGSPMMTNYINANNCKVQYCRYRKGGQYQIWDPIMVIQSIAQNHDDIMEIFTRNKVFYNLLNIIVGDFDRGIMGMPQIPMTMFATNLIRSVEKMEIPADPKTIESVLPVIDKQYHELIKKSYPLVDIDSHSALIPQSQIEKIKLGMIDNPDLDSLRSITIDGLNLMELY